MTGTPVSYWDGLPSPRPSLCEKTSCDVVVVGGGFSGLSTALHLLEARPGLDIVLLEGERIGFGASGRNAGMLLAFPTLPLWLLDGALPDGDGRWALRFLWRSLRELVARLAALAPEARIAPATLIITAPSRVAERGLDWLARQADERGIACTRLDAAAAEARTGEQVRAAIALEAFRGHPHHLAVSLARLCERRGLRIYEGTRVRRIETSDRGLIADTDRAAVQARHAVLCTNAYTHSLGLPLGRRAAVTHSHMIATEPLPADVIRRLGGTDTLVARACSGLTYRRIHDGRLLFGGLDRLFKQPTAEAANDPHATALLRRLLAKSLPWLGEVSLAAAWGGPFHVTSTEAPIIRSVPQLPGVVLNVGYSGAGVSLSLLSGRIVQGFVLGRGADDVEADRLRRAYETSRLPLWTAAKLALQLLFGGRRRSRITTV